MLSIIRPTRSALARLSSCLIAAYALLPFAASAEEIDLPTISVIANRTPTEDRAVGSAVTIIDREELERRQIRLVSDALRSVPGVAVSRSGPIGNQTDVRIRGAESNQTLVLVDGIEVNDPAFGSSVDFAHLLTMEVERIEVLRGPQSALYGSDAIGGVVNIVTKKGAGDPKVTASLEAGNRGTVAGNAAIGGGNEGWDYFVSGGGFRTDGFSTASSWRGNPEWDGYRNLTGFAKFGFNPLDNLRFDIVGRLTDFAGMYDGNDPNTFAGVVDGPQTFDGKKMFGRASATLDLFEGRWQQIFGVSGSRQLTDYFDPVFFPSTSNYEGDKVKFDYQSNLFIDTGDASHTLTAAVEREVEHAVFVGFADVDRTIAQNSIVGQYKLGLGDDLFLTASIRHDMNEMFGDATTWRLTGAYNIDDTGTKLRASWGTGIKNPTLFELFGYFPGYVPNPALRPEQAKGWDLGFDQQFLGGAVVFDATYFDQRITDLIQDQGNTSVNLPGVSPVHGVELGLSATVFDPLTVRASYTWSEGFDANGVALIRRPEHVASLNLGYTFLDRRAKVDLGIVYNGETTDLNFPPWPAPSETVILPAYVLVNLAGSYRIDDTTELYARIENLFDARYEDVYLYGGVGRLAVAGVRLQF
jgi:vitamin B12 transporter